MDNINIYDVILKRESCRDFSEEAPETYTLHDLQKYFSECNPLIKDIKVELKFYNGGIAEQIGHNAGYNGFFIKAPKYLVLFSEKKDHYIENAGYLGQKLTLKMTQLGISACWITIDDAEEIRKEIAPEINLMPTVLIAMGYKNKEKTSVRLDIKSPSDVKMTARKNLAAPKISMNELVHYGKFTNNTFPAETPYQVLDDALHAVSVAQSFMNRQPYRIVLTDDFVYLVGYKDEMTGENDQKLNFGIAMFNFIAVMKSQIQKGISWSFEPPKIDLALPDDYFYVAKCNI